MNIVEQEECPLCQGRGHLIRINATLYQVRHFLLKEFGFRIDYLSELSYFTALYRNLGVYTQTRRVHELAQQAYGKSLSFGAMKVHMCSLRNRIKGNIPFEIEGKRTKGYMMRRTDT